MKLRTILAASSAAVLLAVQPGVFEEVAATGIDFRHENSPTSNKYLLETMGGGVALFDFDNDGDLDVFVTNGAGLADPMPAGAKPDKSEPRYFNRLYRNDGNWKFTDVTVKAGLSGAGTGYGMGVAIGDFDNDGFPDIYLTNYGANVLYRNRGDGTFEDVTSKAGVAAGGWSTSAGFFDYNNDGRLDLFVCRYLDWTFENNIQCGERAPGGRAYCHPDNFKGITNFLYRNNGDGTFTDVSKAAGIADPNGKGLGVAFADYDGDGWTDIYVANDSVMCFLYHNKGNGTFEEVALTAGAGLNEDGKPYAGMGVDFADYDNDGLPDIFVTNLSQETYALYKNMGKGAFQYVTNHSGIGHASRPYSGWSTKFFDYDNDGWKDIFIAQGHVLDTIERTAPNLKYLQPPMLLHNDRGNFTRVQPLEAGAAFSAVKPGRGAAFGDLDNDGDIDIVMTNIGGAPTVLRNTSGNRKHWLTLRLEGKRANRDGIGCRVKVTLASGKSQFFEVQTASGYLSASDRRLTIGLGSEAVAPLVEIRWPGGKVQSLTRVKADRIMVVQEPVE
ncbi:MAG: CRTAC1 family protein [Candidatus Solibacter sp.]